MGRKYRYDCFDRNCPYSSCYGLLCPQKVGMEYKDFAAATEKQYGFVPTLATIPRENPSKRETAAWQLEEIYTTLSARPFSIPQRELSSEKFMFGTLSAGGDKINTSFAFGSVEVKKMKADPDYTTPQVMISLELFSKEPGRLAELIRKLREDFIFVNDISSLTEVEFNDPFEGGEKYIPTYKEVDLWDEENVKIGEKLDVPELGDSVFHRFILHRTFALGNRTAGNTLDAGGVFTLSNQRASSKRLTIDVNLSGSTGTGREMVAVPET